MTMAQRLGATAAAIASIAMFAGLASAQQAAAPAAAPAPVTPMIAGPGGKQVPDLNGIWGGNLVAGGTSVVDTCKTVSDAFAREGGRFAYQGRSGSQQWVTFEQDCGIGHRGRVRGRRGPPAEHDVEHELDPRPVQRLDQVAKFVYRAERFLP